MATAFRSGVYEDKESGISFGSGKYGDLAATTAAMLLDREARSVILDADPAQGSLLEPILKVIRLMKSMEFERTSGAATLEFRTDLQSRLGQSPYESPGVFSFFLPEFQPRGEFKFVVDPLFQLCIN